MTTYGQRGGVGFTRGKRSETIVARDPATGREFRARVFKGQRWFVITQKDEGSKMNADPSTSIARAQAVVDYASRSGYMVAYVLPAAPAA